MSNQGPVCIGNQMVMLPMDRVAAMHGECCMFELNLVAGATPPLHEYIVCMYPHGLLWSVPDFSLLLETCVASVFFFLHPSAGTRPLAYRWVALRRRRLRCNARLPPRTALPRLLRKPPSCVPSLAAWSRFVSVIVELDSNFLWPSGRQTCDA